MTCRHCGTELKHTFLDLGFAPPSNAYLSKEDLSRPEPYYPLRVKVCPECWLVQTEDYARPESLFASDYAYFSSTSASWMEHARRYCTRMRTDLGLDATSLVVEIGSNDGYLLQNFVAANVPCLGIEPTAGTAEEAERRGVPVVREFFTERLAERLASEGRRADLVIGNNVYAHVPDINDFTRGLKRILKPGGTITLEFPHLMRLIQHTQFDTVYHEHYSYLSLGTVSTIFERAGLRVWHVEEIPTHGGSLRVFGCHAEDRRSTGDSVRAVLAEESAVGMDRIETYGGFQERANRVKNEFLRFLVDASASGRRGAAYGAAAKGNTLLNYAGVKPDLLPFVCDASPAKQGKFLPGSHLAILPPSALRERALDFVVVFPWNLAEEIRVQFTDLAERGMEFVVAIPNLRRL